MCKKIIVQSALIGLISTILDWIYHYIASQPPSWYYYFPAKFISFFLVSIIILSLVNTKKIKQYWITLSLLIGIIGAIVFGIIGVTFAPYIYNFIYHLAHGLSGFVAGVIILFMASHPYKK